MRQVEEQKSVRHNPPQHDDAREHQPQKRADRADPAHERRERAQRESQQRAEPQGRLPDGFTRQDHVGHHGVDNNARSARARRRRVHVRKRTRRNESDEDDPAADRPEEVLLRGAEDGFSGGNLCVKVVPDPQHTLQIVGVGAGVLRLAALLEREMKLHFVLYLLRQLRAPGWIVPILRAVTVSAEEVADDVAAEVVVQPDLLEIHVQVEDAAQ